MGSYEIREPIQKRSIEKKEKIIDEGFNLICEKGYYNINTTDIAKAAGVSTGIIYQYFKDKHDILIAGITKHTDKIFFPMINLPLDSKFDKSKLRENIKLMIEQFIDNHKLSHNAHQEIMSMYYTDEEVHNIFIDKEIKMTERITSILINNGFSPTNIAEKVHLSINIIDNLCHEVVFHTHKGFDYSIMLDLVVNFICENLK